MKMAGGVEEAGFWLPSEFLIDDDFLMDKENFNNSESDSEFCFPTEFPYDFGTQSDKLWVMSTSPQSTLAHLESAGASSNGSPSSAPSPPATPLVAKYDAIGDLIYLAAGQVAKLKLNGGHMVGSGLPPARSHAQFYPETKTPIPSISLNTHFQQKQLHDRCRMLYGRQQMYQNRGGMGQSAWAPQHNPIRGKAVLFGESGGGGGGGGGGGAASKKPCVGTGVFLPRRYENISNTNTYLSDSLRKQGRAAAQFHTQPFDNVNGFVQSQTQSQPRINWGFDSDYNSLLAGRHAVLLQDRRPLLASLAEGSSVIGRDLYLPHEWND